MLSLLHRAAEPVQIDDTTAAIDVAAARRLAGLAAAVLMLGVLVAADSPTTLPSGVFARVSAGEVLVQTDEAGAQRLAVGDDVPAGAIVTAADDRATLETRTGFVGLDLSTRMHGTADTLTLSRGSVLLDVKSSTAVALPTSTARGTGLWRVDLGSAGRVGAYTADVAVRSRSNGGEVALNKYRQVSVIDDALPSPVPLRYSEDDAWDAEHMADAIAMDKMVAALRRSLSAEYGDGIRNQDFYGTFFQGTLAREDGLRSSADNVERVDGELRFGPVPDTLIDRAVVAAVVAEKGLSVVAAEEQVHRLRGAGASYGLIMVDLDFSLETFQQTVQAALLRRETIVQQELLPVGDIFDVIPAPESTTVEDAPSLPGVSLPDVDAALPDVPSVDVPDVRVPTVPAVSLPTPRVPKPDVVIPDVKVPDIELPDVEVPDVEVPDVDLPGELPDVDAPDTGTPVDDLPIDRAGDAAEQTVNDAEQTVNETVNSIPVPDGVDVPEEAEPAAEAVDNNVPDAVSPLSPPPLPDAVEDVVATLPSPGL